MMLKHVRPFKRAPQGFINSNRVLARCYCDCTYYAFDEKSRFAILTPPRCFSSACSFFRARPHKRDTFSAPTSAVHLELMLHAHTDLKLSHYPVSPLPCARVLIALVALILNRRFCRFKHNNDI